MENQVKMGDYIFPNWITKILRTPSERTQMESSLVGITVMMLGSLAVTSYLLINGDMSGWLKFFIIVSELGILSFQFSLLSTTYKTYYEYKLSQGMYPEDYKLKLLIEKANLIKEEIVIQINKLKGGNK